MKLQTDRDIRDSQSGIGSGRYRHRHLGDPGVMMDFTLLALVVALVSVVSKEWIYRYTIAEARQLRSEMLMANAWQSRSDAFLSIVMLIGIAGVTHAGLFIFGCGGGCGSGRHDLPSRDQVIEALKQRWPHIPASAIESVTLHYLSGEIEVELDFPIEILSHTCEAKLLVQALQQAVAVLSYIRDVQVRSRV